MKTIKLNDNITIDITDIQIEYLNNILKQSEFNKNFDECNTDELITLLDARKIYCDMFGYQWLEEKQWIPILKDIFKLKKTYEK
jgi:hypothetical protein